MKKLCLLIVFTLALAAAGAAYHFDKCVELNGPSSPQNQYIQLNNEPLYDFGSYFTVEFWLNVREWTINNQAIITKGAGTANGWGLERFGTTNNLRVWWGAYEYYAIIDINWVNQWHHLAFTRSNADLYVYVDGAQVFYLKCWSLSNNYPLLIGENAAYPGRYLHGKVDELRIWNTSRTQNQINLNRYNKLPSTESGLLTYLRLDDQSSTITDATAHTTCTFYNYDANVWQNASQLVETYFGDRAFDFQPDSPKMLFANLWTAASTQFTAEAWVRSPFNANPQEIILKHSSAMEISLTNGVFHAWVFYSDASSTHLSWGMITPDQWYHVALSVNTGGLVGLYINGWLAASVNHSGAGLAAPGVNDLWSVGSNSGGSLNFNGMIDQLRVWNRALTAAEIWDYRHQETPSGTSGLLANYQFNESSMKVIFNQTGHINCLNNEYGMKVDSDWPEDDYFFGGTLADNVTLPVRTISVWGDIVIPTTKKLTVNPGTTLDFIGNYGVLATGSLSALGTEADMIAFTVSDTTGWSEVMFGAGGWKGITVNTTPESDSTLIAHCRI
jgi:hypothetical protein